MSTRFTGAFERPLLHRGAQERGAGPVQRLWRVFQHLFLASDTGPLHIVGFLIGRSGVLQDAFPFGLALVGALLAGAQRRLAAVVGASTVLGLMTATSVGRATALALLYVCVFVVSAHLPARMLRSPWATGALLAVGHVLLSSALLWMLGASAARWQTAVVEALLAIVLTVLFAPLAALFAGEVPLIRFHHQEAISVALLAAAVGLGLKGVSFGGTSAVDVWNRYVSLLVGLAGGAAYGAAAGTVLGLVAGFSGSSAPGGTGVLAVSGLMAGVFNRRGKLFSCLAFIVGNLLTSFAATGANEIRTGLVATFWAAAAFFVTPDRLLRRVSRSIPGTRDRLQLQRERESRYQEALTERLKHIGKVFEELAETFRAGAMATSVPAPDSSLDRFCEALTTRLCHQCSGFRHCWATQARATYHDLAELVASAGTKAEIRREDIPIRLSNRCFQHFKLVQTANSILREQRLDHKWAQHVAEAKEIVPRQLKGIAHLVRDMAEHVHAEEDDFALLGETLADELTARRYPLAEVTIRACRNAWMSGSDETVGDTNPVPVRARVQVVREGSCGGGEACAIGLEGTVSKVMGTPYEVWNTECCAEGPCRVLLLPIPPLELECSTITMAKDGSLISGDAYTRVDLEDGKVAILLSDGMGVGPRAALESTAAVQVLERLIQAGFSWEFSVRAVNSVLLLRSTSETFATLDLAVVDLFTGAAEFVKVGCAPTFLKRGHRVELIRSAALPVGILSRVDVQAHSRTLKEGDVIVMTTDGLLDAFRSRADKEEWVARILRREEIASPDHLIQVLLQHMCAESGQAFPDDTTAVVARLVRRGSQSDIDEEQIPVYRRV